LNENLQDLSCNSNQLTTLHLNENLQTLYCSNNLLTSLQLNKNLQTLYCSNNLLTSLQLNKKLQELACNYNQLTTLHLNEKLEELYCRNNQLTSIRFNEKLKLKIISHNNNPICEIIGVKAPIKQLNIFNKFKYLYYSLKYKKRFRDLLWVKIREPKIKIKYSHDYLVKHLHEDTDLDELLHNW
jgi:Leucine-rich repeat (LRR) protein